MAVQAACIAAALAAIALFLACILPAAAQSPARPELGKFLLGADITGIETTPAGAPAGSGPGTPIVSARAGGAAGAQSVGGAGGAGGAGARAGAGGAGGAGGGAAAAGAGGAVGRAGRAPFTYQEDGKPSDELTILHNHGWNAFRVRIFVPPVRSAPNNPLVNALPLCKRIKALGAKLLLCVHFSDTWADPGKQYIPLAWEGEDINGLEKEWEKHAYDIVKTLKDAGAMPDMIQIGNEITNGAAWPIARVQFPATDQAPPFPGYDDAKQWDNLTRLLKAGVKGAKAAAGKSPLKIAIHIDQGGHWDKTQWFFDHVEAAKVPYDIIAQSCYPQYGHATPEELLNNMVQCAKRYKNKEFMVVETGYSAGGGRRGGGGAPAVVGAAPGGAAPTGGAAGAGAQAGGAGAPGAGAQAGAAAAAGGGRAGRDMSRYFLWPNTPEGQLQFMVDMVNIVRKGPKGAGVFYWAPERAIWNADGSPGPAVFTPDYLTKLTNRPESHVPIQINP
jgi:arabinogalactan endo-1,4-beta-galactosidase